MNKRNLDHPFRNLSNCKIIPRGTLAKNPGLGPNGTMGIEEFWKELRGALEAGTFRKLVLSRPRPGENSLRLTVERIEGRKPYRALWHGKTQDRTDSLEPGQVEAFLRDALEKRFFYANLFCHNLEGELRQNPRGSGVFLPRKVSSQPGTLGGHDREKRRRVSQDAPYLRLLGLADDQGRIKPSAQDKYRQIDKFLEILEGLTAGLGKTIRAADMGAGKGYLTFAAYEFLTRQGASVEFLGLERRADLVESGNRIAQECGFQGLKFIQGDIGTKDLGPLDLLVALHACDTATDDALAQGIRSGAQVIITAPCCHKQVRRDLEAQGALHHLTRFGILEERQAELLTDGLRALILESQGYKAQVFEFISLEHTAKNLMITAVKTSGGLRPEKWVQVEDLRRSYGVKRHYLEDLIRNSPEVKDV